MAILIDAACLLHDNDLYPREGGGGQFLHVLVPRNTFTDVFDNACDICDFRAHIFCPQTTQELPKKRDEAGSPEDNDLPTDALSQIDYGHIRHCEDCLYQRTTQRTFRKIWVGICVWLSRRWASPPPLPYVSKSSTASGVVSGAILERTREHRKADNHDNDGN